MANQRRTIAPPRSLILLISLLQLVSTSWATRFALQLFFKPIPFPYPERERELLNKWSRINLDVNGREVCFYHLSGSGEKVLLVHGWSGRGTQMGLIAERLNAQGHDVWVMDGPGHGQSEKGNTSLFDFISSILTLNHSHGPFTCGIGHSLGGLALLGAGERGFPWEKIGIIGTPNKVSDVIHRFCEALKVKEPVERRMIAYLQAKYNDHVDTWSAERLAASTGAAGLIIHDTDDFDVPLSDGRNIQAKWKRSTIHVTNGLGHRRILRDTDVIQRIVNFVASETNQLG